MIVVVFMYSGISLVFDSSFVPEKKLNALTPSVLEHPAVYRRLCLHTVILKSEIILIFVPKRNNSDTLSMSSSSRKSHLKSY